MMGISLAGTAERWTHSRWSHVDLLIPLVCVGALVVYGLRGFRGFLGGDLGLYLYAGQQFADGVPPYVGVLNRAGPLAHVIPGLGVLLGRAVGLSDVLGARVLLYLVSVAAVCATYVLGRRVFASRPIGLATAAAMLTFGGFNTYATGGPREKTPMVLFLVCALCAVQMRHWMPAGVFVSLAALCWQPVFLVGVAAGCTGALLDRESRPRALLRFALGGAIPAALCVLYFVLVDALSEFVSGFLLINLQYTTTDSVLLEPAHDWQALQHAYGWSIGVFCVGLTVTLLLGVRAFLTRHRTDRPENPVLIASAVAALVGIAWTSHAYNSWPDLFVLLPFAALGIGGILFALSDHLPERLTLSVSLVWVVAATLFSAQFSLSRSDQALVREQKSIDTVLDDIPPDSTFLSVEVAHVLALAGKTNPTRYQRFGHGLSVYMDEQFPKGLTGFGQWITRRDPTVIVMSTRPRPWMRPTLRKYVLVGEGRNWLWYLNRSVGHPTIEAVIDDLRRLHQGVHR
jgi:hypothetical protein